MPICIECRYPVPQLYHVSSSSKPVAPDNTTSPAITALNASNSHAADVKRKGSKISDDIGRRGSKFGDDTGRKGSKVGDDIARKGSSTTTLGAGLGGEAKRSGKGSGPDVRLTQCPRCKRFADKYVEHDFVVLFIDLVLVKPQVYRHLLFNRLGDELDRFDPAITRLGILLLLFDVYLTWSSIEALATETTASSAVPQLPILGQYAFYLILCALATGAQHLVIRTLGRLTALRQRREQPASHLLAQATAQTPASLAHHASTAGASSGAAAAAGAGSYFTAHSPTPGHSRASTPGLSFGGMHTSSTAGLHSQPLPTPGSHAYPLTASGYPSAASAYASGFAPPGPNAISTALFVSSCMQLFPILMVVWKYDDTGGQLATGVSWAVGAQNVEALRILLGCGYGRAAVIVGAGAVARGLVKRLVLGMVGLGGLGGLGV